MPEVDEVIERGEQLEVVIDRTSPPMAGLLMLARRFEISTYDASYLELALRLRMPLATKDGRLAAAAKQAGALFTGRASATGAG